MAKIVDILKKIFYPNKIIVILSIPVTIILMIIRFGIGVSNEAFSYIAYLISAYSLIIVCIRLFHIIKKKFYQLVDKNKFLNKYMNDIAFRTKVSLYQSFSINFLYASIKLFTGIHYKSVWFITLAVYYILLVVMRFLLLQHTRKEELGNNLKVEYKKYKNCGIIMLLLDIVLTGVIILIVHQDNGFQYPGYFIYVMAIYAFYTTISAIVNLIKYRKQVSPVVSASKAINLTVALISMLSLEVAMLAEFGTPENREFDKIMVSITGAVVCVLNGIMAIYMIVNAHYNLKNKILL